MVCLCACQQSQDIVKELDALKSSLAAEITATQKLFHNVKGEAPVASEDDSTANAVAEGA